MWAVPTSVNLISFAKCQHVDTQSLNNLLAKPCVLRNWIWFAATTTSIAHHCTAGQCALAGTDVVAWLLYVCFKLANYFFDWLDSYGVWSKFLIFFQECFSSLTPCGQAELLGSKISNLINNESFFGTISPIIYLWTSQTSLILCTLWF